MLPALILAGPRVHVRPPRREDEARWITVRRKNRAYLTPFEPAWAEDCLNPGFFERRLALQAAEWHAGRGHAFLIFLKENDRLIGGININNVCRGAAQFASLGYWISEDLQGQGYMSESLALVIRYAFSELRLHRLNAGCLLHNERSKKLLLGLGFREEGRAEKYLQIDGEWQDHILFGLNNESHPVQA